MLINLSELFSREGKEKTYTPDIEMKEFSAPEGVYEIVSTEPVVLKIRNLGDRKLLLQGKARLALSIPCDRCLDPVTCPFDLDINQELDMNQTEEDRVQELDEQRYVNGYYLDIDQLVSNELLLNLPMKVLCSEDCRGICNQCGANLNHETCGCDQGPSDPRMAAIQDLFKQFKEV